MDRYFVVERDGQYLDEGGTWGSMATAARFESEQDATEAGSDEKARVLAGYAVTQSMWAVAGGHAREGQSDD